MLHRLKPAYAFLLLAAPACQERATVGLRNAVLEDCASECSLTDTGLDGSSGGTTGADTSPGTTWDETSNSTGQVSGFTSDGDAGGPGGSTGLTITSWPGETSQTGGSGGESGEGGETGVTGDESGDSTDGDTDDGDEFVDLWEPGEPEDEWMNDFPSLPPEGDDEGGSDESGDGTTDETTDETAGETGGDTGEPPPKPEPTCKAGEFTILVYVKYKYGAEGKVSLAAGTLTSLGEETENGVHYKSYLACIPGDKIVGKDAPGVRISAAVAGTDPNDRVVGMRRGIDKNWIGKCIGDPAKSCWIDAKFNAEGKNTLPIAVAVVYVEFARIETAPPPKPVENE